MPLAINRKTYSFISTTGERVVPDAANYSNDSDDCSPQQVARRIWNPVGPESLMAGKVRAEIDESVNVTLPDADILGELFPQTWGQRFVKMSEGVTGNSQPLRLGVVLSGGQAAGGHNVISGIFDYAKSVHEDSQVFGFLNGPHGIFTQNYVELLDETIDKYRNMGGFDMICSGRHKIETDEQKQKSMEICQKLNLSGLVIIGGDDSNTNGAILAEYFKQNNCSTVVAGAPKTIDGDLKNDYIEVSFGFDTAVKTYSESIGNLLCDAATSQDRYHFVRLMGRSASNIALECAMQTRPNLCFVGEEVQRDNRSLQSLADEIADLVMERASLNKNYGVILVPEGLIEFIPEVGTLISEINDILGDGTGVFDENALTENSRSVFKSLPESIRGELLLERDSHGNVQVSRIATEKLLILMTRETLQRRGYTGPFIPNDHFFGYEGRCAMPTNFDSNYCYALGRTACALVDNKLNGYMAVVRHLSRPAEDWVPAGCPITLMMNIERRKGKNVPVIKKYLVELDGPLFTSFAAVRDTWKTADLYRNPGPVQFEGPSSNATTFMVTLPSEEILCPAVPDIVRGTVPKSPSIYSPLQVERLQFRPHVSSDLTNVRTRAFPAKRLETHDQQTHGYVQRYFPESLAKHGGRAAGIEPCENCITSTDVLKIGIVLAGQPVPGSGNVVQGVFERLQLVQGKLFGFKGITGLIDGKYIQVEKDDIRMYANQGGFELLGRTPNSKQTLRTEEGLKAVLNTCTTLGLDGLVVIGGQTSLTDAACLTEFFLQNNSKCAVVGVPAAQENNIKHPLLETAIGFDTTTKMYASLIGNILTDAKSAFKYWYFVKLMGNTPSHVALEAALLTHSNATVITEEYVNNNRSLSDVVKDLADIVTARATEGKNYGCALIPEGVVAALPQMKTLIFEVNEITRKLKDDAEALSAFRSAFVSGEATQQTLTPWTLALAKTLPVFFREALVKETSTGSVEVAELPADQLLATMVASELQVRKAAGTYNGNFAPLTYFLGYQGRSAMPSNFDCALATAHGYTASILVESGMTGMLTAIRGLCQKPENWKFSGVPFTALTKVVPEAETSMYGRKCPMIPCSDVDLKGNPMRVFQRSAGAWTHNDSYCNPGPVQYEGHFSGIYNRTLFEDQHEYVIQLDRLDALLNMISGVCSFGVKANTLNTAVTTLEALATIIADNE